eukprot:54449-Eustigmatos_ZCMA.PRE.1
MERRIADGHGTYTSSGRKILVSLVSTADLIPVTIPASRVHINALLAQQYIYYAFATIERCEH